MHGEGRFGGPDGSAYEGQFVRNLMHGQGLSLWPDGRRIAVEWKDGKQHGTGVHRSANGALRTGMWCGGALSSWVDDGLRPVHCLDLVQKPVRGYLRHGDDGFPVKG